MKKTLIIAEAGENHNGDMELAYRLIDVAKAAGADIVKFQTSVNSISKCAEQANYQRNNTGVEESQLDMANRLRLGFDNYKKLKIYCDKVGITFLSTGFDVESIRFLTSLGQDYWKIPSGDIFNVPLLEEMAKNPKPVLLSTGMADAEDVEWVISFLRKVGLSDITLLQCTTQYPTPYEDVNLMAMPMLGKQHNLPYGLSDHSQGIEASIAAVALGASVIEKHFTLDKELPGPDHKASLSPEELTNLVRSIRIVESCMGSSQKQIQDSERENIAIARKSIVANKDIKKGEVFSEDNITTKRPGTGISSVHWHEILGQKAWRDFSDDELIDMPEESCSKGC